MLPICTPVSLFISFYSAFKLFTGLAIAAFTAWKLTVKMVITNARAPAKPVKIHQLMFACGIDSLVASCALYTMTRVWQTNSAIIMSNTKS